MKVSYDNQHDILDFSMDGVSIVDGASLDDPGVVLHFGTDGGTDVVALTVMGASCWFNKSYDESSDTWTFGDTNERNSVVTTNGDFLGYWPQDELDDELPLPTGLVLLNVSKHLAGVRRQLVKRRAATTKQPQA